MDESQLRKEISITHIRGVKIKQEIKRLTGIERALEALNSRRRRLLEKNELFTMYDSVDVSTIPKGAIAVAGYVGGKWPTFHSLISLFSRAKRLSIAVNSLEDADCLDIENGDATPADAPGWVRRQKRRGLAKPMLYSSLSVMPTILAVLRESGIHREDIKLWVAHYTDIPHIPTGFDGCQYTDKALGRNLDASLCHGGFI